MKHSRHLILTMLSCGLWAPIWFIAWVVDAFRPRTPRRY